MNKHIKYIIEHAEKYLGFNPADIQNDNIKKKLDTDTVIKQIYDYIPKDSEDLRGVLQSWIKKGITDFNGIYTGHITDFSYLFVGLDPGEIDISQWDVHNGKYFRHMFYNCINLKCDFSQWDVHNGIDFTGMFYNCKWVEGDFRNWDLNNALCMDEMFFNCRRILLEPEKYVKGNHAYFPETNEELKKLVRKFIKYQDKDLNCIDVSKITDFSGVFKNMTGLYKIGIDKWDVSNGVNFHSMFAYCQDFTADLSKWDVSNGVDFSQMFGDCLTFNSNLSKWKVSKGEYFYSMFWKCRKLKSNLTNWDLSNAVNVVNMFYEVNTQLKKPSTYTETVRRIRNAESNK